MYSRDTGRGNSREGEGGGSDSAAGPSAFSAAGAASASSALGHGVARDARARARRRATRRACASLRWGAGQGPAPGAARQAVDAARAVVAETRRRARYCFEAGSSRGHARRGPHEAANTTHGAASAPAARMSCLSTSTPAGATWRGSGFTNTRLAAQAHCGRAPPGGSDGPRAGGEGQTWTRRRTPGASPAPKLRTRAGGSPRHSAANAAAPENLRGIGGTCPVSTGRGTRRVQLVREEGRDVSS